MTAGSESVRAINLFTPDGVAIIGTLEVLHGSAGLEKVFEDEKGKIDIQHDGETKVFWDGQTTMKNSRGDRIFICANGNSWAESKLLRKPA
jgi:hypothetical protein